MSRSRKRAWVRVSGSHQNSGGSTTGEISLTVPKQGWIRRVRLAGTGNLSASIGEASSPGTFGVVLAYSAAATPVDQEEDPGIFYSVSPTETNGATGTLFVDTTTTSADSLFSVQLDIEPAN